MNNKPDNTSALPVTIRFFLWALSWSVPTALTGCFVYSFYHNVWLRTFVVDVALILTGLLITSGLVAFAEWRPEQASWSRVLLRSGRTHRDFTPAKYEAEKVKEEIELLEREKGEKSLLQELKARRDSLREEVKGV